MNAAFTLCFLAGTACAIIDGMQSAMCGLRNQMESEMNKQQVTAIRRSVFGTFGLLNGREVEFCRATRMWAYTDGSGYAYGAHS